jgi:hypothetical protein
MTFHFKRGIKIMTYKHSIDDFTKALGGSITPSGNGVKVPHPFDESRNILVYPNRDIKSRTAFFIQIDDDERTELRRHLGAILDAAGIDARDTGVGAPLPETEPMPADAPEPMPADAPEPATA